MASAHSRSPLGDLFAPPLAIFSPINVFSARQLSSRPLIILLGVVLLTAIAAGLSGPVTVHLLRNTPAIGASRDAATNFAVFQYVLVTPIGTAVFLTTMTLVVWVLALFTRHELAFTRAATIVFIAGIVGALERVFVAIVLYIRWWQQPATLGSVVTTGLDGFVPAHWLSGLPGSLLRESGIFEIWFCVLLAVGLEHAARFNRTSAVGVAAATGFVLICSKLLVANVLPA